MKDYIKVKITKIACKFAAKSDRSSHQRCFLKKDVLKNFAKLTGKHLCQSFFFNNVAGLRLATLLKNTLWHRCFPMNFAKFLRTPYLQNSCRRLPLKWPRPKNFSGNYQQKGKPSAISMPSSPCFSKAYFKEFVFTKNLRYV